MRIRPQVSQKKKLAFQMRFHNEYSSLFFILLSENRHNITLDCKTLNDIETNIQFYFIFFKFSTSMCCTKCEFIKTTWVVWNNKTHYGTINFPTRSASISTYREQHRFNFESQFHEVEYFTFLEFKRSPVDQWWPTGRSWVRVDRDSLSLFFEFIRKTVKIFIYFSINI